MFFLNKETAAKTTIGQIEVGEVTIWRYIPRSKYMIAANGHLRATAEAFSIKRKPDGKPKEPSASFFQLKETSDHSLAIAVSFLQMFQSEKNYSVHVRDASGSIQTAKIIEMTKDPKIFSLAVSSKQVTGSGMLHWDLKYAKNDLDQAMQDAKNALSLVCDVYSPAMQVPAC